MYILINDFTPTRSDEEQAKRYRVGIRPRLGPRKTADSEHKSQ
jgi:hypothetical protein